MGINWAPVLGEFKKEGTKLIFKGSEIEYTPGYPSPAIGNFIADRTFAGGIITAEITFDSIGQETGCGIIFYHDTVNGIVVATLGSETLYSINIFPTRGQYTCPASAGDGKNLKANQRYKMQVSVAGSFIKMNVDGVDILSHQSKSPLPRGQIGIWCRSRSDITIDHFEVSGKQAKAFVVMQLTSPYTEIYEDVIRRICDECEVEVVKADEIYGPGVIISDIEKQIIESNLVIAEITPANPNVYYEVGFAHAFKKPTILIADKEIVNQLPFDVSPFRVLLYENTIAGKSLIEAGLRKHIKAILSEGWQL